MKCKFNFPDWQYFELCFASCFLGAFLCFIIHYYLLADKNTLHITSVIQHIFFKFSSQNYYIFLFSSILTLEVSHNRFALSSKFHFCGRILMINMPSSEAWGELFIFLVQLNALLHFIQANETVNIWSITSEDIIFQQRSYLYSPIVKSPP